MIIFRSGTKTGSWIFYLAADCEGSAPDFSGRVFMRVIFPLTRTGSTLGWAEYNFTLLTLPSFQENPP